MHLYNFFLCFLLFFIYSFLGWFMESIAVGIEKRKFINRGFLIGPYCPIYGFSAVMMILLLGKYQSDPFVLFIMAAFICTFFEYITSFLMEKLFKARWWDYSHKTFNINGRVCLNNSLIFGILGCLLIIFINPFITRIISDIPHNVLIIFSSFLFVIFIIDNILSFNIISKFKVTANNIIRKDSTEEISEKIKEILKKKSILSRRLVNAFPDVKAMLPELKAKYEEQKKKFIEKIR